MVLQIAWCGETPQASGHWSEVLCVKLKAKERHRRKDWRSPHDAERQKMLRTLQGRFISLLVYCHKDLFVRVKENKGL